MYTDLGMKCYTNIGVYWSEIAVQSGSKTPWGNGVLPTQFRYYFISRCWTIMACWSPCNKEKEQPEQFPETIKIGMGNKQLIFNQTINCIPDSSLVFLTYFSKGIFTPFVPVPAFKFIMDLQFQNPNFPAINTQWTYIFEVNKIQSESQHMDHSCTQHEAIFLIGQLAKVQSLWENHVPEGSMAVLHCVTYGVEVPEIIR